MAPRFACNVGAADFTRCGFHAISTMICILSDRDNLHESFLFHMEKPSSDALKKPTGFAITTLPDQDTGVSAGRTLQHSPSAPAFAGETRGGWLGSLVGWLPGIIKIPIFWGNQTMQMYGVFDGFHLN